MSARKDAMGAPDRPEEGRAPREDEEPLGERSTAVCDLCGGAVVELHCKVVCQNCGYQRDCSDP